MKRKQLNFMFNKKSDSDSSSSIHDSLTELNISASTFKKQLPPAFKGPQESGQTNIS